MKNNFINFLFSSLSSKNKTLFKKKPAEQIKEKILNKEFEKKPVEKINPHLITPVNVEVNQFLSSFYQEQEKTYKKIQPSEKQSLIINYLKNNFNVIVNASAGSGKTTTTLLYAQQFPEHNILLLTFSADLKREVREKVEQMAIDNVEVHSYHSFGYEYASKNTITTDHGIKNFLDNKHDFVKHANYDLLVIDEIQDMNPLYFAFVKKFLTDEKFFFKKIMILGDPLQMIFDFKESNEKYLLLANEIFKFANKNEWKTVVLDESFRITKQMSNFLNDFCMIKHPIISNKTISDSVYLVNLSSQNNFEKELQFLSDFLLAGFKTKKFLPHDVFVLAPSIKKKSFSCQLLENILVKNGVFCFAPIDDDSKLNDKVIEGKLVFANYHQSKGRERKIVIVYGFDIGYENYFLKNPFQKFINNAQYVAMTRASEKLILVKNISSDFPTYVNKEVYINNYLKVIGVNNFLKPVNKKNNHLNQQEFIKSVSELCKYLNPQEIGEINLIIEKGFIKNKIAGKDIILPNVIKFSKTYEIVSEISAYGIVALFEYLWLKKSTYWENVNFYFRQNMQIAYPEIKKNILYFLKMANYYVAACSGFNYKITQIKEEEYNWLQQETVNELIKRLRFRIGKKATFEKQLSSPAEDGFAYYWKNKKIIIQAQIDIEDENTIWEIKCVSSIELEHKIQLAIYQFIYTNLFKDTKKQFKLFNLLNNEVYTSTLTFDDLTKVLDILLTKHTAKKSLITDQEFLNNYEYKKTISIQK